MLSGNNPNDGSIHMGVLQEWFGFYWWNSRELALLFILVFVLLPLVLLRRVGLRIFPFFILPLIFIFVWKDSIACFVMSIFRVSEVQFSRGGASSSGVRWNQLGVGNSCARRREDKEPKIAAGGGRPSQLLQPLHRRPGHSDGLHIPFQW